MCGRYGRRGSKQKIAEAFSISGNFEETDFEETFDAAPGSIQPVVRIGEDGRVLENMRWGFKLSDRLLFNTRAENVLDAKFWKDRVKQRCIVPVSIYFEWLNEASKPKPKFEITVSNRDYFGIAAVYGQWKNPKTDLCEATFSTFTTEPNALIQEIHVRQPVILEPRDYQEWIEPSERFPSHLLRIFPEDQMRMVQMVPKDLDQSYKPKKAGQLSMDSLFG